MNGAFEADLIRPLGLVTLNSGYAEEELNDLLRALSAGKVLDERKYRWRIGQKLAHAEELIRQLDRSDLLTGLSDALAEGHQLFKRHNALVHGSLYAGGRLSPNGDEAPADRVTADDLTKFAESLFAWKERIWLCRQKDLPRAIANQHS